VRFVRVVLLEDVRSSFSLPDVAATKPKQSAQSTLQVLSHPSCRSPCWPLEDDREGASPVTERPEREVARQRAYVFPICQIAPSSSSPQPKQEPRLVVCLVYRVCA
jgi:hypothetical protein